MFFYKKKPTLFVHGCAHTFKYLRSYSEIVYHEIKPWTFIMIITTTTLMLMTVVLINATPCPKTDNYSLQECCVHHFNS